MAGIMFWLVRILTKKTNLPLIGCQSKCRMFTFKFFCKRCLP